MSESPPFDPDLAHLPKEEDLLEAIEGLYSRLTEATELLRALRASELDAVLYAGTNDPKIFMLRSADRVYRIIIEQMCEGAALVSEEGEILYANGAMGRLVDLPAEALVGEPAARFVEEGFLENAGDDAQREILLRRVDGGTVPALLSSTVLDLETIRVRSIVLTDITARQRAEDRLRATNEALEERVDERTAELNRTVEELRRSNEELQRFAYVASHDLQEPLRSIVSFSQLLERRCRAELGTEGTEYLDFIVEGGLRMQTLITDLLSFSRLTTKGQPLVETDAKSVLTGVLNDLTGAIEAEGATIEVGPMPRVMADPAQLAQVFANLIGNALKYRRAEVPPRIRVSARREERFWRIAVEDNGIGIEPEYFDRIFVIFQRLHTRDAYPGTGIGLAVVKNIVERHGGSVRVESTPNEGSTFSFTLPAA